MPRIVISSPDGKRGILEIAKPVVSIGRGTANDLVLNDTSVSRFHAVVKLLPDGAVVIADRGSTNGVIHKGHRIADELCLEPGDSVHVGIYELKLEQVRDDRLVVKKADIPSSVNEVLLGRNRDLVGRAGGQSGTLVELARQVEKLQKDKYLLTVLYDAGKALNSKLSVDDISEQVMSLVFRIEGVERGFMMLLNAKGEVLRQTDVRYRRPPAADQPDIIFSRAILDRIKTELAPILINDSSSDERFSASESMKISGLRSAMIAPLISADGSIFGILYVDNLQRTSAFTEEELNVFALVAAQAAAAMDNARAHELLAEQAIQRSALERFLSPDVVEMIAANPQGIRLGGANQKVTIVFADIRGFTEIAERLAPEMVVEILNEFFTRVTDVIFDNGGTLDKYIGDGVMTIFGAPFSKGSDAANGVKAAMEIQNLMFELNRDAINRGWPELRIGIGVNTGMVTAGNVGSPRRFDYTVIGDAVNVAARLMAHAGGGQILITEYTAREIDRKEFNIAKLQPILVKGKSEPVNIYAVRWMEKFAAVAASPLARTRLTPRHKKASAD